MKLLTESSLPAIQQAIADAEFDGWLLYDFRGVNGVAGGMIGLKGMVSRRIAVWIPRSGTPVAVSHAIEQLAWADWPAAWPRVIYSAWEDFESHLGELTQDRLVAMEYSEGDAVPVVDRVPAGIIELVKRTASRVVTSAELITKVFAVWTPAELTSHRDTAEILSRLARQAFAKIGAAARTSSPMTEYDVMRWLQESFSAHGLVTDHGPNVSATEHAANPHYEPTADAPRYLREGDTVLIDLWAKPDGGMWADQTYMASIGTPSPRAVAVWEAIRDARDAALTVLRDGLANGGTITGAAADDAARAVIRERGFGPYFTHRTGHSIDSRGLHGAGPNLDNLETRETRRLIRGVGFSVEPGIYIPGEIGMRTEVNGFVGPDGLIVTPSEIQHDLIIV
jgi:Xaa-Pro aminopeptidase